MVRALSTLALSVLLLTGANAQSVPTPAGKKATAAPTARAARRAAKKAQRAAIKTNKATRPATAATPNDGWPPLTDSAPVVASTDPDATYGAAPSQSPYGRDNVYAAPGMPVNVRVSKQADPYSVRPPRKSSRPETTLTNGQ